MTGAFTHRATIGGAILLAVLAPMELRADRSIGARTLFADSDVLHVTISPSGEWSVTLQRDDDFYSLVALRIKEGLFIKRVFGKNEPIQGIRWLNGNTLLVTVEGSWKQSTYVITLILTGENVEATTTKMLVGGWLEDPLISTEGAILWGFEHNGYTSVHRTTLEDLVEFWAKGGEKLLSRNSFFSTAIKLGDEVARVRGSTSLFIVDSRGIPRATVVRDDESVTLVYRDAQDDDFRVIARRVVTRDDDDDEYDRISLVGLTQNEEKLLALAYGNRNTRSLFEFDVSIKKGEAREARSWKARIGRLVFGREDVDLTDVLIDDVTKELVGVIYEIEGERKYHYFDAYRDRYLGDITNQFPNQDIAVASASADHSAFILWTSGPTNPGTYIYYNRETERFTQIAKRISGLDLSYLRDVTVFEVGSRDGTRIEAFLAMPELKPGGSAPLVVIPHGGPIGVRDNVDFDPLQQYLASWGMAVLKVNYRGSAGYGRDFEEAGKREWSRGIEDDIDAAVELVMKRPDIDQTRICIAGTSYGGYSALVSTLRHPDRYRCSASINGVTDVPFLFESSDFVADKRVLRSFVEIVGDPDKDLEAMIEISPLFRAEDFRAPILFIYGTEDRRVDPDHSYRLMTMLDIHHKSYESLEIPGQGHRFNTEGWMKAADSLRSFLMKHLFFEIEPIEPERDSESG